MRVIGLKHDDDGWSGLEYRTTYRMEWMGCLAMAKVLYDYSEEAEVLIQEIAGAAFKKIDITNAQGIMKIPEAGVIQIRGKNKVYDIVPFMYIKN